MKKRMIATGICGALIASNVITGWQFKKEIDTKDQVINNLHSLTEQFETKMNTYEIEINELNEQIDIKDGKLVEVKQKLKEIEAKNRSQDSP